MRNLTDLYIHPPVEQFGLLEWSALERAVEAGYRHTSALIEREWT
jgi:predicted acylesterase/phospholipase RssA